MSNYLIFDLKRIKHPDGDLIKGLDKNFPHYSDFGESYYSYVTDGKIKAWRLHQRITNHIVVIKGKLNVNIIDESKKVRSIIIDSNKPKLLIIYPKNWYGYQAIQGSDVLIHNITNLPYEEDEVERFELKQFEGIWYK